MEEFGARYAERVESIRMGVDLQGRTRKYGPGRGLSGYRVPRLSLQGEEGIDGKLNSALCMGTGAKWRN